VPAATVADLATADLVVRFQHPDLAALPHHTNAPASERGSEHHLQVCRALLLFRRHAYFVKCPLDVLIRELGSVLERRLRVSPLITTCGFDRSPLVRFSDLPFLLLTLFRVRLPPVTDLAPPLLDVVISHP
jgi:hypothetical protein